MKRLIAARYGRAPCQIAIIASLLLALAETSPASPQRLLALTLGIYLNCLLGRPPRALAAYDGR